MYQSQRVGDRVRVVEELCERQRARVVELLTGHSLEDGLDVLDLPASCLCFSRTACFVGSRTQSSRRMTVSGSTTLPYSDCL